VRGKEKKHKRKEAANLTIKNKKRHFQQIVGNFLDSLKCFGSA